MGFPGGLILKKTVQIPEDYIAYWPFNGNANDESGNGHNGTVVGAALVNGRKGKSNGAYFFDGINDYITVPSFSRGARGFTISTWIKEDGQALNSRVMGQYGTEYTFQLINNSATPQTFLSLYLETGIINIVYPVSLNVDWNHIVITTTGIIAENIYMYINGVLVKTEQLTDNAKNIAGNFVYGRNPQGNFQYWRGSIDDTRYYNRRLTAAEINALYNE